MKQKLKDELLGNSHCSEKAKCGQNVHGVKFVCPGDKEFKVCVNRTNADCKSDALNLSCAAMSNWNNLMKTTADIELAKNENPGKTEDQIRAKIRQEFKDGPFRCIKSETCGKTMYGLTVECADNDPKTPFPTTKLQQELYD